MSKILVEPAKLYIVSAFSLRSKRTIYAQIDLEHGGIDGDGGHTFFYPDTQTEIQDRDDADLLTLEQAETFICDMDSAADGYNEDPDSGSMWISHWKIERK